MGSDGSQFFSVLGARSDAYRGPRGQVFVRGVDTGCLLTTSDDEMGKLAPSLRVAANYRGPRRRVFVAGVENRGPRRRVFVAGVEIRPYFILALDGGPATAFGLGFVSTPRTKTYPRESRSGRHFACNAAHPIVAGRLYNQRL